jgi:hypothetical protein
MPGWTERTRDYFVQAQGCTASAAPPPDSAQRRRPVTRSVDWHRNEKTVVERMDCYPIARPSWPHGGRDSCDPGTASLRSQPAQGRKKYGRCGDIKMPRHPGMAGRPTGSPLRLRLGGWSMLCSLTSSGTNGFGKPALCLPHPPRRACPTTVRPEPVEGQAVPHRARPLPLS